MIEKRRRARLAGVALLALVTALTAAPADLPLPPRGIGGSLVICGGGPLPEPIVGEFLRLAGGPAARLVVIPTAAASVEEGDVAEVLKTWTTRGVTSVKLLHTRSREMADSPSFVAPLGEATAVWIGGGDQKRLADAYVGTSVERALGALLRRGGVIGGTSAGAAIMTRVMIAEGNPRARVTQGLDLLPGAVVDQHFLRRNRPNRLVGVLADHPGRFGLGVDEETAVVVRGRSITVLGNSYAVACLSASRNRPFRIDVLRPGDKADLVSYHRAAIARSRPAHPPEKPPVPEVPHGTLVIVGGGKLTDEIVRAFIDAAGGRESPIVVIPTAMAGEPRDSRGGGVTQPFRAAGCQNVVLLHAREPAEIERPEFLDVLGKARGVWFTGGRQWRLVDAYMETSAYELFHYVLRRGGVIGGSSAGATIQGGYLVRGNPLGNTEMMAEGYERGFAFLPGVDIDQHFAQRGRFADMTGVMSVFPQLLGIGIDESTALVVRGSVMEVIGENRVAIYDRARPRTEPKDYESLDPGARYDLKERRVLTSKDTGESGGL